MQNTPDSPDFLPRNQVPLVDESRVFLNDLNVLLQNRLGTSIPLMIGFVDDTGRIDSKYYAQNPKKFLEKYDRSFGPFRDGSPFIHPMVEIFITHRHITKVEFQNLWIRDIPPSIHALIHCKNVDISNCPIRTLNLPHTSDLVGVTLENTFIDDFSDFYDTPQLQTLCLNHQRLIEIPDAIMTLKNLTHLELTNNSLINLEAFTHFFSHLEILNIQNNPCFELPREMVCRSQLRQINLSSTAIDTVPADIAEYKRLIIYTHQSAQLRSILDALFQIPFLNVLDVANNQIEEVPPVFWIVRCLRTGIFSNNKITHVNFTTNIVKDFFFLSFRNNLLTEFPHVFTESKSGINLDLSGNSFTPDEQAFWKPTDALIPYPRDAEYYLDYQTLEMNDPEFMQYAANGMHNARKIPKE